MTATKKQTITLIQYGISNLQAYSNPKKILKFIATIFVLVSLISIYFFNQKPAPVVEKEPIKEVVAEISVSEKKPTLKL
ncbi:hypothetical protein ACLKMH_19065 [Psychromonas sp. KJ10-10]|uniref:hypothetical protein n=1 Tax=Psychromonas sp. KJ10-10 TaxID=3391823 RepID=UPI0039B4EF45